jgi:sugar phosphate isomerase/epimerase
MAPKTAFSTLSCPDWSFRELIDHGTRYGFDGVEIRLLQRQTDLLAHPDLQPSQLTARRRELDDAGFSICGLSSSVNFHSPHADERDSQIDTGCRYLDMARTLGAGWVRVFGDVLHPTEDGSIAVDQVTAEQRQTTTAQVADGLQRLGEYAHSLGLSVIIETHGDFADTTVMRETLDQVECPAVGVLWDTHHPWRFFGESLPQSFERLRPWIRHTHWKDSIVRTQAATNGQTETAAGEAHGLMSGHRHADYVLFRGGEFPALECMWLLRNTGYDGWFCYEWEKMWHPEIEDPEKALPLFPPKIHELWSVVDTGRSGKSRLGL